MYRGLNLAVAFLVELAALAAFCWWGFTLSAPTWARIIAGIGAPVVAAVLWGLFAAAARPRFRLPYGWKMLFKAVFFGLATAALVAGGAVVLGIVFALIVVVNTVLIRISNLDEGIGA
jgi:hypothetical protein